MYCTCNINIVYWYINSDSHVVNVFGAWQLLFMLLWNIYCFSEIHGRPIIRNEVYVSDNVNVYVSDV